VSVRAERAPDGIYLVIDESEERGSVHVTHYPISLANAQRLVSDLSKALIADGVLKGRGPRAASMPDKHQHPTFCPGKRAFESEEAAMRGFKKAPCTLRPYQCPGCKKWHVTNPEKA
jgi:hypothetical protein